MYFMLMREYMKVGVLFMLVRHHRNQFEVAYPPTQPRGLTCDVSMEWLVLWLLTFYFEIFRYPPIEKIFDFC